MCFVEGFAVGVFGDQRGKFVEDVVVVAGDEFRG
jgi:hypothetical protein